MNEQYNSLQNESAKGSRSIWIIVSVVIITALIVGGGVYAWQKSNFESIEQTLRQQIQILQNEIKELKNSQNNQIESSLPEEQTSSSEAKAIIQDRAEEVILAIKNQDSSKLAKFAHPNLGVRFSPYSYVDKNNDLVFTASQLQNIFSDSTKYKWGVYDGSGFPIELTFEEYYNQFIYDQDYINAEKIGYNEIIGRGNTLNNNFEIYPNAIILEFHFSGFDPKYSGMDWSSLRLVFEQNDSVWYLVGIIHDQWTI